jgi:hypothetical protein
MNKRRTPRRRACRAAARTLAIAAAAAALATTLGAGQALAGPDERVLERQGRIDRQAATSQADEQGKGEEPSQSPATRFPRRYFQPEPPMDAGPRLEVDEPPAPPWPPKAPAGDRDGLALAVAAVALLLAAGAAATWRINRRRPPPEPTT